MTLTCACVQDLAPALIAHGQPQTPSAFWYKLHNKQLQRRPSQSLSAARLRQRPLQQRRLNITAAQKQQFSSFDDMVQNSDLPILVDFYATWCGPCQMLAGVLTTVSSQLSDKVKIVKIGTDKYPKLASRYRIQNAKQVDRIEGNDAGRMCMNAQLLVDRLQSKLLFKAS